MRDQFSLPFGQKAENYTPFSIRRKEQVGAGTLRISVAVRKKIIALLQELNQLALATALTDGEKKPSVLRSAFNLLKAFYIPKSYYPHDIYLPTNRVRHFLMGTSPLCVLDYMEAFSQAVAWHTADERINALLQANHLPFKLLHGLMTPDSL